MNKALLSGLLCASMTVCGYGYLMANTINPAVSYPPDTWVGRSKAVIRVLDKLENRTKILMILVGKDQSYKNLNIAVKVCVIRPPTMPADSAAFVTITDSHTKVEPFSAWILQEEPAASVFENPLYNVSIVGCDGQSMPPNLPDTKQGKTNSPSKTNNSSTPPPSSGEVSKPVGNDDSSLEQFLKSQ